MLLLNPGIEKISTSGRATRIEEMVGIKRSLTPATKAGVPQDYLTGLLHPNCKSACQNIELCMRMLEYGKYRGL